MRTSSIMGIAAAAALAAPLAAQQPAPAPPQPPRCEEPPYRAFDFWLGEWEVRTPGGQLAGHNSITSINNGCALLESYSQQGNPAGQSYNFYDHVRESWTQIWLSPGVIIRIEGPISDPGTLTLTGTITYMNQDAPRAFVGRWTEQEDGSVRQEFWEQNPDTGEWGIWFTGIYTRTD